MGAGSLLCSDVVLPLSAALGWRTASPQSSPPPAYHFRAPCSFLCWACDNSTSCCNLPDNSQSVLLNLSFYLLWLLVSVYYPGGGGLLLTSCHPLVDLLNLSLLQYVRMLFSFDMDVLIAFLFCMGEEQNLSNSTAFQIASPRLSNNR